MERLRLLCCAGAPSPLPGQPAHCGPHHPARSASLRAASASPVTGGYCCSQQPSTQNEGHSRAPSVIAHAASARRLGDVLGRIVCVDRLVHCTRTLREYKAVYLANDGCLADVQLRVSTADQQVGSVIGTWGVTPPEVGDANVVQRYAWASGLLEDAVTLLSPDLDTARAVQERNSTHTASCRLRARQALLEGMQQMAGSAQAASSGCQRVASLLVTEWCDGGDLHTHLARMQQSTRRSNRAAALQRPPQLPVDDLAVDSSVGAVSSGTQCFDGSYDALTNSTFDASCGPYGIFYGGAYGSGMYGKLCWRERQAAQLAAVGCALDIARGLAALHAAGQVHGALEPGSVMCSHGGGHGAGGCKNAARGGSTCDAASAAASQQRPAAAGAAAPAAVVGGHRPSSVAAAPATAGGASDLEPVPAPTAGRSSASAAAYGMRPWNAAAGRAQSSPGMAAPPARGAVFKVLPPLPLRPPHPAAADAPDGGGGAAPARATAGPAPYGTDLPSHTAQWRALVYVAPEVLLGAAAIGAGGSGAPAAEDDSADADPNAAGAASEPAGGAPPSSPAPSATVADPGTAPGTATAPREAPEGAPADVFALGALLWQLCSGGRPPHSERHPAQILVGLLTGELDPGRDLDWPEDAAPEVAEVGRACLHRSPQRRPTAKQAESALAAALDRMLAMAAATAPAAGPAFRPSGFGGWR